MNLLAKNTGAILMLALFLFSCEDPNEIGLTLNDDRDKLGVLYTEIPLTTSVILNDSISTTNNGNLLVGAYVDANFGRVGAQAYTQFLPGRANPAIPADAIIDSLVLKLKHGYFHGINFNASQTISVHELTDLLETMPYYTFNTSNFAEDTIGFKTFVADPLQDTVLTMQLNPEPSYIENLVQASNSYKNDSTTRIQFHQAVRGLALIPGASNTSILGFDITDDSSRLTLHYHTAADTASLDYRFNTGTTTNYTSLETDRSGTPLAGLMEPYTEFQPMNEAIFLQAATGIVPKINVAAFKNFTDTAGSIIINYAEFSINDISSPSQYLEAPNRVVYYLTNESNQLLASNTQDPVINSQVPPRSIQEDAVYQSLVSLNRILSDSLVDTRSPLTTSFANGKYTTNLTLYLQLLSDGKIKESSFEIFPVNFNYSTTLSQFVVGQNDLKLKIYYTKLKE